VLVLVRGWKKSRSRLSDCGDAHDTNIDTLAEAEVLVLLWKHIHIKNAVYARVLVPPNLYIHTYIH